MQSDHKETFSKNKEFMAVNVYINPTVILRQWKFFAINKIELFFEKTLGRFFKNDNSIRHQQRDLVIIICSPALV
jgi:hypothetical protein